MMKYNTGTPPSFAKPLIFRGMWRESHLKMMRRIRGTRSESDVGRRLSDGLHRPPDRFGNGCLKKPEKYGGFCREPSGFR